MNAKYIQKDLGYTRTQTAAKLRVQMPNGSEWDVPVQAIADSRDTHYASDEEDTIGGIRAGVVRDYEIQDWAANNMNWSDVEEYSMRAEVPDKPMNWEDGWTNGDKTIIGEI